VEHAHAESLTDRRMALSIIVTLAFVLGAEQSIRSGEQVLLAVNEGLRHDFGIGHTTIQVEVMRSPDRADHHH